MVVHSLGSLNGSNATLKGRLTTVENFKLNLAIHSTGANEDHLHSPLRGPDF